MHPGPLHYLYLKSINKSMLHPHPKLNTFQGDSQGGAKTGRVGEGIGEGYRLYPHYSQLHSVLIRL